LEGIRDFSLQHTGNGGIYETVLRGRVDQDPKASGKQAEASAEDRRCCELAFI